MPETKSLEQLEGQIKEQLDRIYRLLDEGKNAEFIKLEYKRIVELITQKYLILQQGLEVQSGQLSDAELTKQRDDLKKEYKDDVIAIAVAIDDTLEGKK